MQPTSGQRVPPSPKQLPPRPGTPKNVTPQNPVTQPTKPMPSPINPQSQPAAKPAPIQQAKPISPAPRMETTRSPAPRMETTRDLKAQVVNYKENVNKIDKRIELNNQAKDNIFENKINALNDLNLSALNLSNPLHGRIKSEVEKSIAKFQDLKIRALTDNSPAFAKECSDEIRKAQIIIERFKQSTAS